MDLLQTSKFYKGFKKIDQLVKQKYLNFLKETANNLNYQSNVQNYIDENTSFNYKTQVSIDKTKIEQQKEQKQQLDQDFIQIPTTQEQNYIHQSNYDKSPNDIKILNKSQVKGPIDMQIKQFEEQQQDDEQLLAFDQNNQTLNRNLLQQQIKQLTEYDKLSNKNIENKEQFFDQQYLQNSDQNIQTNDYVSTGDIVQLVHLDTGMLLSLTEKKISRYLIQKMCKIQNPCEENYSKQEQIFTLKQLDEKRLLQGENFDIYFEQDQKRVY
ncbi:hypothetical protein PPERSA_12660 [Pseudocohnilembus persalinus]|uniref:Uncharacterized protein n=1 Tax=Pseudocohnilembus persalinus TaxID=266149 RepID=A0A0V0QN55_PSEPJ|nr:hypothetical protein PPERSA_12660 [Pseudocohnilembus persalinus]|eukprot:KRX03381.1 hypothetical protein PPERSA_12660 [Pseudocohnilembus persalinus]